MNVRNREVICEAAVDNAMRKLVEALVCSAATSYQTATVVKLHMLEEKFDEVHLNLWVEGEIVSTIGGTYRMTVKVLSGSADNSDLLMTLCLYPSQLNVFHLSEALSTSFFEALNRYARSDKGQSRSTRFGIVGIRNAETGHTSGRLIYEPKTLDHHSFPCSYCGYSPFPELRRKWKEDSKTPPHDVPSHISTTPASFPKRITKDALAAVIGEFLRMIFMPYVSVPMQVVPFHNKKKISLSRALGYETLCPISMIGSYTTQWNPQTTRNFDQLHILVMQDRIESPVILYEESWDDLRNLNSEHALKQAIRYFQTCMLEMGLLEEKLSPYFIDRAHL